MLPLLLLLKFERSFPVRRELVVSLPGIVVHPPDEVTFVEASRPNLRVVSSCHPKLARCFADFALVAKFVEEVESDH